MSAPASVPRATVLEPPGRFSALRVGDFWRYRELLYILAWRDVRVRYKQAVLGAAWAVIQPLIFMGIFTLLFTRITTVPTGDIPYPVFAFAGLVPWMMFANAVGASADSLVSNSNLVSKVWFPRLVIPGGAVLTWVPDFVISSVMLFVVMGVFGHMPEPTAVLLPLILIASAVAAFSVGVWLSALNVAYRDVKYVVPFVIQVWLFITPIAYPTSSIPENLRWAAGLNPMSWVVEGSRWALVGSEVQMTTFVMSAAVTTFLLLTGMIYFRRVEHFFADVI